jgi:hypothetical protein
MKTAKLDTMSLDALIERFVEIGVDQDEAFFHNQIGVFNRLYKKKAAVVAELKARDGDQRRALIPLYTHPNMQGSDQCSEIYACFGAKKGTQGIGRYLRL